MLREELSELRASWAADQEALQDAVDSARTVQLYLYAPKCNPLHCRKVFSNPGCVLQADAVCPDSSACSASFIASGVCICVTASMGTSRFRRLINSDWSLPVPCWKLWASRMCR